MWELIRLSMMPFLIVGMIVLSPHSQVMADDIGEDVMSLEEIRIVHNHVQDIQTCLEDDTIPMLNPWLSCLEGMTHKIVLYFIEPDEETFEGCHDLYQQHCLEDLVNIERTLDEYLNDLEDLKGLNKKMVIAADTSEIPD